jgi:hypothetical protein
MIVNQDDITVILTDIYFWAEHVKELDAWCEHNSGVRRTGCLVEFDTSEVLILFVLRWS